MRMMHKGNVVRLPVARIEVGTRLRKVDSNEVKKLMLMAEDAGIIAPIQVRKVRTRHVLIDGAHRLEVAKQMGMTEIAALVWDCRADEAKDLEASSNLGGAKMSALQTAVFVASWKRTYYELHPDRKPGVFKGNQHTGRLVRDTASLANTVARTFGVTDRHAKRILRAGETLLSTEIEQLEAAPRLTMKDILDISKIGDRKERAAVVAKLGSGEAKSAKEALKSITPKAEAAARASAADQQWRAMCDAFARATKVARRRFVQDNAKALRDLLAETGP